jgi:hypothetical protein
LSQTDNAKERLNFKQTNNKNNNNNLVKLFIYLLAELNSQWPVTESTQIQTATVIRQHRTKQNENLSVNVVYI